MQTYYAYVFANDAVADKMPKNIVNCYSHALAGFHDGANMYYFEYGEKVESPVKKIKNTEIYQHKNGNFLGLICLSGYTNRQLQAVMAHGESWKIMDRDHYQNKRNGKRGYPYDCLGYVDAFLEFVGGQPLKKKKISSQQEAKEDES